MRRRGLEEIPRAVERQLRLGNYKSLRNRSAQQNRRRRAPCRDFLHEARARDALLQFPQPIRNVVLAAKVRQPLELARTGRRDQHLFARTQPPPDLGQKCLNLSVIPRCRLHFKRAWLLVAAAQRQFLQVQALPPFQSPFPLFLRQNERVRGILRTHSRRVGHQSIARRLRFLRQFLRLIEHDQCVLAQVE